MRIKLKLLIGFLAIILMLALLFLVVETYNQNELLNNFALEEIKHMKFMFDDLEERDIKILASSLEVVIQDPAFKELYLEKDRDKLYNYGQPLFQRLKNEYGITHWYFILPDGRCFVRLHNKEIYGDDITRATFDKARSTQQLGSGIELGKTAFALRTVMPYYHDDDLIGYVELGEEIDHFLKILKGETKNEFAIIAEKEFLDRKKWESVRQTAGLRDNWNDYGKHLILAQTIEEGSECFTEENLERIEEGEMLLEQIQDGNQTFVCGGFLIQGADGQHTGAILSLIDITDHLAITQNATFIRLVMTLVLFIIALTISIVIAFSISKPIQELTKASEEFKKGNLNYKIKVKSKDEIGELAKEFDEMRLKLKEREATAVKDRNALLNSLLETFKGKFGKIATILMRKNIQALINKNPRIRKILPKELAKGIKVKK